MSSSLSIPVNAMILCSCLRDANTRTCTEVMQSDSKGKWCRCFLLSGNSQNKHDHSSVGSLQVHQHCQKNKVLSYILSAGLCHFQSKHVNKRHTFVLLVSERWTHIFHHVIITWWSELCFKPELIFSPQRKLLQLKHKEAWASYFPSIKGKELRCTKTQTHTTVTYRHTQTSACTWICKKA